MKATRKIILQTEDLSIGYEPANVLAASLSVSLYAGELVCLIGPNGVGKSTLMRTLAGMQPPLSGRVLLMGDEIQSLAVHERARRLSIVLTERPNIGMLSGYALVALGRYPYTGWTGKLSAHDEAVVRWAVEAVGAESLALHSVDELSDGERQKILVARALAQEPALMLLDEPTAFLDLPRRVEIMQLLRQLARTTGQAILLSTHDLDLALRSADRIWLMAHDEGLQIGAPEDLVLSGAFEQAFRSEGVAFDIQTGSFHIDEQPRGEIVLNGEGIHALWTRRALEREGFIVREHALNGYAQVWVIPEEPRTYWHLVIDGETQEYDSMYDLIAHLHHETNK